ncbi:hypothetical protein D3C72_1199480 [compost metagenome]
MQLGRDLGATVEHLHRAGTADHYGGIRFLINKLLLVRGGCQPFLLQLGDDPVLRQLIGMDDIGTLAVDQVEIARLINQSDPDGAVLDVGSMVAGYGRVDRFLFNQRITNRQ